MEQITYYILPATGHHIRQKKGTVKDILLAIPYLLNAHIPPKRREKGHSVIPPLEIINEILSKGIESAGMSGGCKWEPFQINKTDFEELVAELLADDPSYFHWVQPPEWVKTRADWTAWTFELLHGGSAQEYRKLDAEIHEAYRIHVEAGQKDDNETERDSYRRFKEAERKLIELITKYVK